MIFVMMKSGCIPKDSPQLPLEKNNDTFDVKSSILQLYIVDIRSIGNCMLHEPKADEVHALVRPITVDVFLQKLKSKDPCDQNFKVGNSVVNCIFRNC